MSTEYSFPWKLNASDLQGSIAKVRGNDIVFSDPHPAGGRRAQRRRRSAGISKWLFRSSLRLRLYRGEREDWCRSAGNLRHAARASVLLVTGQSGVPGGYIYVSVAPGKTQSGALHYRLFAPAVEKPGV